MNNQTHDPIMFIYYYSLVLKCREELNNGKVIYRINTTFRKNSVT